MLSNIDLGRDALQGKPLARDERVANSGRFPQAWSQIVYQLVPNIKILEKTLTSFAGIIDADEILLFEKATFLVRPLATIERLTAHLSLARSFRIAHANRIAMRDASRKSVISSNSSSCHAGTGTFTGTRISRSVLFHSKLTATFQSMEVRNSAFACFIELLTPNTYVMVVISDPSICK